MKLIHIIIFLSNITYAQKYRYEYVEKDHDFKTQLQDYGIMSGIMLGGYLLTQFDTIRDEGSFTKWRNNLGKVVIDKDSWFWNLGSHPFFGGQMYLYFRARGYDEIDSIKLNFLASATFEFLLETYTEPASLQDLYNTTVLGAIVGYGIERGSLYLLNETDHKILHVIAHIFNPATLFDFFSEKNVYMAPNISRSGQFTGYSFFMEF